MSAARRIPSSGAAGRARLRLGCSEPADVGAKAFVPYTADYFFYTKDDKK